MKMDRRTPVDLVSVLIPKKKVAIRTAEEGGMWKVRLVYETGGVMYTLNKPRRVNIRNVFSL